MSAGGFGISGASPSVGGAKGGASETVGTQASSVPKDVSEHTVTLQNQLALTSHMCSQLLYGQNSLIRAVCERLDRPEVGAQMEERMAMLQQYQLELEAYYQQLYASYAQVRRMPQTDIFSRCKFSFVSVLDQIYWPKMSVPKVHSKQ